MRRFFLSRRNIAPSAAGLGSVAGIIVAKATEGLGAPTELIVSLAAAVLVGGVVAVLMLRAAAR